MLNSYLKEIKANYNMLADSLPLRTPLTLGVGSKALFCFLKVVILHIKLIGIKQRTECEQMSALSTPSIPGWGQSSFFFSEGVHVAYKIKRIEVYNIMQGKCLIF